MAGPKLWISAGPLARVHFDQYEKLWLYGFMIYAGRDNFSGHVISIIVLRNKFASSILRFGQIAFEHTRGCLPYESQFDRGTECAELKDFLFDYGYEKFFFFQCTSRKNRKHFLRKSPEKKEFFK